jgi:hypothetical protein
VDAAPIDTSAVRAIASADANGNLNAAPGRVSAKRPIGRLLVRVAVEPEAKKACNMTAQQSTQENVGVER